MAISVKDLKDAEILRFQRFSVVESAAATFTEQSYDTQLSIDRGLIWLIHFIEFYMTADQVDDPAQNAYESLLCQITRESKTAEVNLSNADLVALHVIQKDRTATIGTDAGPVIHLHDFPSVHYYNPPIAYAAQNIYIAVQSTSASAQTVTGRIGYTLRKVSDKFFYRVAQALIS